MSLSLVTDSPPLATAFPDPRKHATYLLEACCGNYLQAYEIAEFNAALSERPYWDEVEEALWAMEPELPMIFVDGLGHPLRENCIRQSEMDMFNRLLAHCGSDRRWMLLGSACQLSGANCH